MQEVSLPPPAVAPTHPPDHSQIPSDKPAKPAQSPSNQESQPTRASWAKVRIPDRHATVVPTSPNHFPCAVSSLDAQAQAHHPDRSQIPKKGELHPPGKGGKGAHHSKAADEANDREENTPSDEKFSQYVAAARRVLEAGRLRNKTHETTLITVTGRPSSIHAVEATSMQGTTVVNTVGPPDDLKARFMSDASKRSNLSTAKHIAGLYPQELFYEYSKCSTGHQTQAAQTTCNVLCLELHKMDGQHSTNG